MNYPFMYFKLFIKQHLTEQNHITGFEQKAHHWWQQDAQIQQLCQNILSLRVSEDEILYHYATD